MIANHIEDIALEAYEAGQIRASDWQGFMPSPIPQIYMQHMAMECDKFVAKYPSIHRPLAKQMWASGFLDQLRLTT